MVEPQKKTEESPSIDENTSSSGSDSRSVEFQADTAHPSSDTDITAQAYAELTTLAVEYQDSPYGIPEPNFEDTVTWEKRGEMRLDPIISEIVGSWERAFRKWGRIETPDSPQKNAIEAYLAKVLPDRKLRDMVAELATAPWDGGSLLAINYLMDREGDIDFQYIPVPQEYIKEIKISPFRKITNFELDSAKYVEASRIVPRENSIYFAFMKHYMKSWWGLPLFAVFYNPYFVSTVNMYQQVNDIQHNTNILAGFLKNGNDKGSSGLTRREEFLRSANRNNRRPKFALDAEDKLQYITPTSTIFDARDRVVRQTSNLMRIGANVPGTNTGGEEGGSYALAKEQVDARDDYLTAVLLRPLETELNIFIERLIRKQFDLEDAYIPKWRFTELKDKDIQRRQETITQLRNAGVLTPALTASTHAEGVLGYIDPELREVVTYINGLDESDLPMKTIEPKVEEEQLDTTGSNAKTPNDLPQFPKRGEGKR